MTTPNQKQKCHRCGCELNEEKKVIVKTKCYTYEFCGIECELAYFFGCNCGCYNKIEVELGAEGCEGCGV